LAHSSDLASVHDDLQVQMVEAFHLLVVDPSFQGHLVVQVVVHDQALSLVVGEAYHPAHLGYPFHS
jgi:hypothetical protein